MPVMSGGVIFLLVVALIVFLVCREFVCWYFKLNALLQALERIESQLGNVALIGGQQVQALRGIHAQATAVEALPAEEPRGDDPRPLETLTLEERRARAQPAVPDNMIDKLGRALARLGDR
jgi:hypothetical protein